MHKDFLSIKDLTGQEIAQIFDLSEQLKKNKTKFKDTLKGKALALIFQKPSCRTRISFEVGIYQLGGYSIYLGNEEINLGVREAIKDIGRTLSRYVDAVVIRTYAHENILELARHTNIPVINGLSDLLHPCQALSDIYSIKEKLQRLKGITLAYIGDGNNVCHCLLYGAAKVGMNIHIATPEGYGPNATIVKEAKGFAKKTGTVIQFFDQPEEAVSGAEVIYTDVWVSMGQEAEANKKKKIFKGYQVNEKLITKAKKDCLVMHCLPAHRGEEISDRVIDGRHSIVFDQAENRLHVQKAIMIKLLGER